MLLEMINNAMLLADKNNAFEAKQSNLTETSPEMVAKEDVEPRTRDIRVTACLLFGIIQTTFVYLVS